VNQILSTVDLKTERHDLRSETIAAENDLIAVSHVYFLSEHNFQQLRQQAFRVKYCNQHSGEFIQLLAGSDIGQCHGDREFALVALDRDKVDESLEAVGEDRLGEGVELGALLQDLGEDLHEGGAGLGVAVVAEGDGAHEAAFDVGVEEVGHGDYGGDNEVVRLGGGGLADVVAVLAAVVEQVHEEGEVFEEELGFGLHQVAFVVLLGLQW